MGTEPQEVIFPGLALLSQIPVNFVQTGSHYEFHKRKQNMSSPLFVSGEEASSMGALFPTFRPCRPDLETGMAALLGTHSFRF